jgi:hypothetical protein
MNKLKKRVNQLNPDTDFLEKMLGEVPTVRAKSTGFDYKVLNKLQQSQDTKFSPAEEVLDPYIGNMMPNIAYNILSPIIYHSQCSIPNLILMHVNTRKDPDHGCAIIVEEKVTLDLIVSSCMDTQNGFINQKMVLKYKVPRRSGSQNMKKLD